MSVTNLKQLQTVLYYVTGCIEFYALFPFIENVHSLNNALLHYYQTGHPSTQLGYYVPLGQTVSCPVQHSWTKRKCWNTHMSSSLLTTGQLHNIVFFILNISCCSQMTITSCNLDQQKLILVVKKLKLPLTSFSVQ